MTRRTFIKVLPAYAMPLYMTPALLATTHTVPQLETITMHPSGIPELDAVIGGGFCSGIAVVIGHCGTGRTSFLRRLAHTMSGEYLTPSLDAAHNLMTPSDKNNPVLLVDDLDERVMDAVVNADDIAVACSQLLAFYLRACSHENMARGHFTAFAYSISRNSARLGSVMPPTAPSSLWFAADVVIQTDHINLDGHGQITIHKNRMSAFKGTLTI